MHSKIKIIYEDGKHIILYETYNRNQRRPVNWFATLVFELARKEKLWMRRSVRAGAALCYDKEKLFPTALCIIYTRKFTTGLCVGEPEAIKLIVDKLVISTLILFDVKGIEDRCVYIAEDRRPNKKTLYICYLKDPYVAMIPAYAWMYKISKTYTVKAPEKETQNKQGTNNLA